MEFKFSSAIFKNDPADNRNNNPNFPTHGGILKMPLSQLEEFVQYLHWAARTELQSDSYMNEKIIPVKISGWTKDSNGKKFLSLSFEPHYKTNMAAQEAKEAQGTAGTISLQEQQPAQTTDTAAASLAQGTAGTVVEDIF
jgi:hypothetical protein